MYLSRYVICFTSLLISLSMTTPSLAKNHPDKHKGQNHSYGKYHKKSHAKLKPQLVELWTVDQSLSTPESVVYDKQRDVLYVSNILEKACTPHEFIATYQST